MTHPLGGYQQQPGYGGGYGGQIEHPQGTTVLILGIIGIVACQLCAPFAWAMGNKALEEIDRNPLAYSNRSNVQLGRILGIVGTAIIGVSLLLGLAWLAFVILVLGASASSGA